MTASGAGAAPRLSIIIVVWNIRDVLRDCLQSLYRDDLGVSHEVIVFDNGSADGTPEMVAAEFPRVTLLRNPENLGFAKGNNEAMKAARGDYFLLLNSDTVIIDSGIFRQWIDFMDAHPDVGMSGCQLLFPDRNHQVGDAGYRPSPSVIVAHNLFLSRLLPGLFRGLFVSFSSPPGRIDVDWISGADVLVRSAILPQVGLLDEEIFIYAEDIEWGCRVRSFGHRVCYLSDMRIVHLQGATTGQYPAKFSGMDVRNLRQLYHSLNPRSSMAVYDIAMALGFLARSLLYSVMLWRPREYRSVRAARMYRYFGFSLSNLGKRAGATAVGAAASDARR
jgi:N-acetylglucosaminyl-diphospho-decaprenol L-rhamnosyltransferase